MPTRFTGWGYDMAGLTPILRFDAVANDPVFTGPDLERRSISEQVAHRILGMIKSGNLKSGDRLPTEAQMTLAFGISRPPLREALKALVIMGVLESRQGGRYTVTDLSPSRLVAPFNAMLSVAEFDAHSHFEARALVDGHLIRLCTERATPEMRQRIMALARDGEAFHDDPIGFRLLDIEFHQSINTAARHPLLATVAQSLYDLALDFRRIASAAPGNIAISVAQHIDVARAITARDPDAANAAYCRHLEHVRDSTLRSMSPST